MKKYDKIIAISGVIILILAGLGIYYWVDTEPTETIVDLEDLFGVSSEFSMIPEAISISDECPFYPLIVTPLAVSFDNEGEQHVIPLYIKAPNEPSKSIIKADQEIGYQTINEFSDLSAKEYSLYFAEKYWKCSEGVLLIENNESGYNLGVVATPIASYLGIPVIVTDKVDMEVRKVLDDLGVMISIVCGDLEGYGKSIKFNDIDEINDVAIKLITEKLEHDVGYVTVTNPRDAWPPEVINVSTRLDEQGSLISQCFYPSNWVNALKGGPSYYSFTIPNDYKYALVKVHFRNLEDPRYVEQFGDDVSFMSDLMGYARTTAYPSVVNDNGKLIEDDYYFETVLYDMGGKEYTLTLTGFYHILPSADFELKVTVEKLEDPYYPMMKQFSSIAPYLTAAHEGIIFAKPDFAFVADDNVKLNGKTIPGNTQPWLNPILVPVINQHVYENIYMPLNQLIAKIKGIDITDSVKILKEECSYNPINIAVLGDTVMVPQYYYRSEHSDPFSNPRVGTYGTNTPSDFIYGNIDPELYSLQPYETNYLENDIWSEYPEAENIVGRITGYDIQDASALIARTLFYNEVLDYFGEWKDNAAVLLGAGAEVQKLPVFTAIQQLLGQSEPMKFPTGEKYFLEKRILENFEEGGFNAIGVERGAAQRVGFTTDALWEMKTDGLLNFLFFPMLKIKFRQGFQNKDSLLDPQWWIDTLFGDSSELCIGGELEQNSNLLLCDGHAIYFEKGFGDIMLHSLGGPLYELIIRYVPIGVIPRTSLDRLGGYGVRDVTEFNMGPSVMLAEGCGSGKIDGMIPQNNLANAYLHAGANAYISPTTFSAFYGALEPRPNFRGGVGFGVLGYMKAWLDWKLKGQYPDVNFNQYIFEETVLELAHHDVSIGQALRDSKNKFLPATFDVSFRWRPVLDIHPSVPQDIKDSINNEYSQTAAKGFDNFPVEKYSTIYQINLLGDPAFNPYEPCNNG